MSSNYPHVLIDGADRLVLPAIYPTFYYYELIFVGKNYMFLEEYLRLADLSNRTNPNTLPTDVINYLNLSKNVISFYVFPSFLIYLYKLSALTYG